MVRSPHNFGSNHRFLITGAILLLAIFLSAVYARHHETLSRGRLEQIVLSYSKQGLLDYDLPSNDCEGIRCDLHYLRSCVDLANIKYGHNLKGVLFNPTELDDRFINIIFFKDDPVGAFRPYRGNCFYTGHKNTIICDLSFVHQIAGLPPKGSPISYLGEYQNEIPVELQDWFKQAEIDPSLWREMYETIERSRKMVRTYLVMWVLGHEIGHLVRRHTSRHFAFAGEPAYNLVLYKDEGSRTLEQEADNFAMEAFLERRQPGYDPVGQGLWIAVGQFVYQQAREYFRREGITFIPGRDYDQMQDHTYIVQEESKTHPPMFLRSVMLGQRLAEDYNLDSTGFFRRIREHIILK